MILGTCYVINVMSFPEGVEPNQSPFSQAHRTSWVEHRWTGWPTFSGIPPSVGVGLWSSYLAILDDPKKRRGFVVFQFGLQFQPWPPVLAISWFKLHMVLSVFFLIGRSWAGGKWAIHMVSRCSAKAAKAAKHPRRMKPLVKPGL